MNTPYLSKQIKDFMQASLLAVSLLGAHNAMAEGDRGGNGGDGITIDGKLYVLDLVEAGIENGTITPFTEDETKLTQITNRLKIKLPESVSEALAHKLAEISKVSPVFAAVLLRGVELYQWRFVNSALVDIRDENSLLDYQNLVQLAIRRNGSIMISRAHWEQLDSYNQAALVLHEVLYALVRPKDGNQDSVVAREIVGYIFAGVKSHQELGAVANDRIAFIFHDLHSLNIREIYDNYAIGFNPQVHLYNSKGSLLLQPGMGGREHNFRLARYKVAEACAPSRNPFNRDADLVIRVEYTAVRVELVNQNGSMVLSVNGTQAGGSRYQMPRRDSQCDANLMTLVQRDYNEIMDSFDRY